MIQFRFVAGKKKSACVLFNCRPLCGIDGDIICIWSKVGQGSLTWVNVSGKKKIVIDGANKSQV